MHWVKKVRSLLLYLFSSLIVLYLTFLNDYSGTAEPVRTFLKNIFDKLRHRHSTYALGIVTLKLEIITFSSVTDSKRIETSHLKTNYLDVSNTACTIIVVNRTTVSTDSRIIVQFQNLRMYYECIRR